MKHRPQLLLKQEPNLFGAGFERQGGPDRKRCAAAT